jgi:hypothetical protein
MQSARGGPAGSGSPFTGGCDFSAHADSLIWSAGGQTLDCSADLDDAQVGGDGNLGSTASS